MQTRDVREIDEATRLLVQFHQIIAQGKGDEEEADKIRDAMEGMKIVTSNEDAETNNEQAREHIRTLNMPPEGVTFTR